MSAPTLAAAPRCRPEHTGSRPSRFSAWHRSALPAWALACDIDLVELRDGRGVVAVLEVGQVEGPIFEKRLRAIAECKELQLNAVGQIATALGVPGFFVLHTPDMTNVGVLDVVDEGVSILDEEAFRGFLERL